MEYLHETVHGLRYYWEYLKRFGKQSCKTWVKDFVIALILAIIPIGLAWGDRGVLQNALLAIGAIALLYGFVALRHLVYTSLILFRERAHPEYGGIQYTHWVFGIWGGFIFLALIVGMSYGAFHEWLYKLPPVVLNMPAPVVPKIEFSQLLPPKEAASPREIGTVKHSPQTGGSQAPTSKAASQSLQQIPPQVSQSQTPTATFLDRVVQENRALTPDDRNRFSTELYECDEFIKQGQAVAYKLNAEFGKLDNDRASGILAKDVDDHIKVLQGLDSATWAQYHGLQRFQEKWQYFEDQTQYLFGDNPFNAGEGLLVNATEGMANELTSWSKISNRDQRDILNIEAQQQNDFVGDLRQFFDWTALTLERIKQMKESLDPNATVQPIRSKVVAPARSIIF